MVYESMSSAVRTSKAADRCSLSEAPRRPRPTGSIATSTFMQVAPLAEKFAQRIPAHWLSAGASRHLGVQLGEMNAVQMVCQAGRAELHDSVVVKHGAVSCLPLCRTQRRRA